MAGWLGLLKSVPWNEVVSNAPKIAEGAKSLWGAVSKRIRAGDDETAPAAESSPENNLAARIATLEASQRELHAQLATSSELIRSLAEQNAQLVTRLDVLRLRLRWLGVALLLVGGVAVAALLKVL